MADVITRFKLETTQYDSKLRDAAKSLVDYTRVAKQAGDEMDKFTKGQADTARALGNITTSATNAKDKVRELVGAYNDVANAYNNLTKEQQQSEFGRAMAESLNTLKGRITEAKQELYSLGDAAKNGKFGQFGGIIDGIGHKIGITGNLTEMLTSKTALLTGAIGAGAAIVGKSAKEWAAYNAELARQDQITQVTTGLKGEDADSMTDKMRALSDTYKVNFRDAINAANTLMSQFGETGESAIQLIKDGMQGMIQGDGPKLLSMIQQYAPAFRDAGVSASQLVAVIQNSEGGIFTDQNMQAIVMGIKNIRLMTKATSDALAQLGIDGQKMSEQMSNGSMTVFDALKQVAGQLKTVDSNSKTAGEVMQTVFGRQGAMAGTNLAKAIEGLNTDLEQTKKQTGEVGKSFADLQEANERLNTAIRDCFEYDGWDQMANSIRSNLITALAAVIEKLGEIRDFFTGKNQVKWDIKTKPGINNVADDPNVDANGNYIRKPNKSGTIKVVNQTVTPEPIVKPIKPTKPTGGNKTIKTEEQLNNEQIQKLTQEYIHASEQRQAAIRDEIKVLQERNELIQALKEQAQGKGFDPTKMQYMSDLAGRIDKRPSEGLLQGTELTLPVKLDIESPEEKLRGELERLQELLKNAWTNAERDALKDAIENVNGQLDDMTSKKKRKDSDDGYEKFSQNMSKLTGGISSIASGFQQMGMKLPTELQQTISVIQGLMSVIEGVHTLISIFGSTSMAANTAALIANTAAINLNSATSIIPFAGGGVVPTFANGGLIGKAAGGMNSFSGGIVPAFANGGLIGKAAMGMSIPGNSFSGDNLRMPVDGGRGLIGVNSGELILNRAQQGVIAGALEGTSGSVHVTGEIQGEKIVLAANRYLKRSGQGELVTWK